MAKKETVLQGRIIHPNQVLMDLLDEEKFKLVEVSSDRAKELDLEFSTRIQQVKNPLVIKAIEERSDERTFELFMALIGYDRTKYQFRKPISEEKFLFLLDESLEERVFYDLVHSRTEIDEINFLRDNNMLHHEPLRKILAYAYSTNRSEGEISQAYMYNRQILNEHREKFRKNDRIFEKLDDLALAFLPSISDKYRDLVSSKKPKMSLLARIQRLVNHYVCGDISIEVFSEIFALRSNHQEIIPALNKALTLNRAEE